MKHFLVLAIISTAALAGSTAAAPDVRPQFVGCKSDGQVGPQPAPKSVVGIPNLPAKLAGRLAYYKSANLAVLAPRGWRCFGVYGSNGASLFVTPTGFGKDVFDLHLKGSAVQLSASSAETSGRFEAARTAARLFPNRASFVEGVVAEGIEPKSDFTSGPLPTDRIWRRGPDIVEFETPAHREGMGTESRLVKNGDPIRGTAVMDEDNNATVLFVRLPLAMRDLSATIIKAAK